MTGTREMLNYTHDRGIADGLNDVATGNAGMIVSHDLRKTVAAMQSGEVPDYGHLAVGGAAAG